jgi:transcription elongation factor Elf1
MIVETELNIKFKCPVCDTVTCKNFTFDVLHKKIKCPACKTRCIIKSIDETIGETDQYGHKLFNGDKVKLINNDIGTIKKEYYIEFEGNKYTLENIKYKVSENDIFENI